MQKIQIAALIVRTYWISQFYNSFIFIIIPALQIKKWFWQRMLSTNIMLTKQAYTIHLYTKSPRCQNSNDNGPVQLLLSQNKRPKIDKIPSQISLTPKRPPETNTQMGTHKTFSSVIIPHFHWLAFSQISQQPNKYPNGYP